MFQSYDALWRTTDDAKGTMYVYVRVLSAPVFGHVKIDCDFFQRTVVGWAVPLAELVGLDGDGCASPGRKMRI